MMDKIPTSKRWMVPPLFLKVLLVLLILAAGTWIRAKDPAAPPLDVSHTPQLLFLLTARASQSAPEAVSPALPTQMDYASIAPDAPLLQWVDGKLTGLFHADLIMVARGVSISGWMIASLLVYLLIRRITRPLTAIAVLTMMVFLPFGIQFSRVVLPGSWAMVFAVLSLWQLWRWMGEKSWGAAIAAGLLGSVAVLLQSQWLYLLLGGLTAAWWSTRLKQKEALPQALFLLALIIAPRLVYALWLHPSSSLVMFLGLKGFSLGLSSLKQLVRLELRLESIIGVLGIGFALIGVLLTEKGSRRSLLIGLWAGFALLCLVSLKAISDSIYVLYPVILLSSVSFIPLFETLLDSISENGLRSFNLWILAAVMVIAAGLGGIDGRRLVKANPEQIPVDFWLNAGQKLGPQAVFLSNANGVTLPLAYYGGIQPACISASGDCTDRVDQVSNQMPDAELYFVFFKSDLEKVLSESDRLSLSEFRCDLGSGVMMIPLTSNHPACSETGG